MNYKITNLEYGIGPWGTEVLYGGIGNPAPGAEEDNVHSVTLLEDEDGKKILVDTGVDEQDADKKALWDSLITEFNGTITALAQVGLTPEDIDVVLLTHAHLDHIGAVTRFTNAQIYIQREEFEAWEEMAADPRYLQLVLPAAFPPDYPVMRKMIEDGKVTLLDGDVEDILPGISLHVVKECHSVAEQLVVVNTEKGKVVVAGDIACRPANLFGSAEFDARRVRYEGEAAPVGEWAGFLAPTLGRSGSARCAFKAYEWIREVIEDDPSRLVLTHDTTMHDRFETNGRPGLAIHYIVK